MCAARHDVERINLKIMLTKDEAIEVAKEYTIKLEQHLRARHSEDIASVALVVSLILYKLMTLIMDNLGETECFTFLDCIHSSLDMLYTVAASRMQIPKEDRKNSDQL